MFGCANLLLARCYMLLSVDAVQFSVRVFECVAVNRLVCPELDFCKEKKKKIACTVKLIAYIYARKLVMRNLNTNAMLPSPV